MATSIKLLLVCLLIVFYEIKGFLPISQTCGRGKGQKRQTITKSAVKVPHAPPSQLASGFATVARCGAKSLRGTLTGWILTSVIGGAAGSPFVTIATSSWYRKIELPDWTPPDRIFGPVWTILYSLMGYAAYQVYQKVGLSHISMKLAFVHYLINISWAPVFFGMQRLRLGHAMNLAMIATLLPVMKWFYDIKPASALCLVPYLFWLLFATALSEAICRLNPTVKGYNNAMMEADICKLQKEAAKRAEEV